MDIRIKTGNLKFKFRVSAVFIYKGKLFVDSYGENRYCLPGGYVSMGGNIYRGYVKRNKGRDNTRL